MRAAIKFPIKTVGEPLMMMSGGPTHVAMSVIRAAGRLPINTVGQPGGRIGPPTCGTTPVTIGQTCMSVTRAAKGIRHLLVVWQAEVAATPRHRHRPQYREPHAALRRRAITAGACRRRGPSHPR